MLDDLITKAEIERDRTPQEFVSWFEAFLEKTRHDRQWRRPILLHQGIAKQVYEEVFPLFRLLQHKRELWAAHGFRNILGNQPHDVAVTPTLPGGISNFEITVADRDQGEALRMEHFVEHGTVSGIGPVTWTGTGRSDRVVEISNDMQPHAGLVRRKKEQLAAAIQRKCQLSYGRQTALLVYFDDHVAFADPGDEIEMHNLLDVARAWWTPKFGALHIVGASGRALWEEASTG